MEKDLIQLQEELSESDGSSSDDSSNDGYCSDNEIQSKTKGKSSKHSQGGGSKKNTASKKTHRNQSNVSSDDECLSEVERKSNPNKNSSSGKHQKEELRQGNTVVTLRKTQRNHPEAEAMFTLYRIGFCSVSKVAPVQCEQELMFCCGAGIVPKRSQCEQKPYPLCNLQRSLLI